MKKNKEWAFIELGKLFPSHAEMYDFPDDITVMKCELLNKVYDILSQLDEPEVLSQEWISENEEQEEMYGTYGVPVRKLENLLVPKQEVLSQEWIDKHSNGSSRSQYVWVDDLKEILVSKWEEVDRAYKDGYEKGKEYMVEKHRKSKPVIPSFVAEWIENKKENEWGDLFDAMRELLNIPLSGHQESGVARWIRKAGIEDFGLESEDVLAKLWLDGYEVAEESKYRLKLNGDYLSRAQIDYEADKGKPIEVTIRADVKGLPYNFSEDEKSYVEKYLNVEVEELEE